MGEKRYVFLVLAILLLPFAKSDPCTTSTRCLQICGQSDGVTCFDDYVCDCTTDCEVQYCTSDNTACDDLRQQCAEAEACTDTCSAGEKQCSNETSYWTCQADEHGCLVREEDNCPDQYPICIYGVCVQCTQNSHCPPTEPLCTSNHVCIPCGSDGQYCTECGNTVAVSGSDEPFGSYTSFGQEGCCGDNEGEYLASDSVCCPHPEMSVSSGGECYSEDQALCGNDCTAGATACNEDKSSVVVCDTSGACPTYITTTICPCFNGACVECLEDPDCSSNAYNTRCDETLHECVQCSYDAQCPIGFCQDNVCVECRETSDCAMGYDCVDNSCESVYGDCSDTDSTAANPLTVRGTCTDPAGQSFMDYCDGAYVLTEYSCVRNHCVESRETALQCSQGVACTDADSDGYYDQEQCEPYDSCRYDNGGGYVDSTGCPCEGTWFGDRCINVTGTVSNQKPVIGGTTYYETYVGQQVDLDYVVRDPDGDQISVTQVGKWSTRSFTPEVYASDPFSLAVIAVDSKGAMANLTIRVLVRPTTDMPETQVYRVEAGQKLVATLPFVPETGVNVEVDPPRFRVDELGRFSWTPLASDAGENDFKVSVTNLATMNTNIFDVLIVVINPVEDRIQTGLIAVKSPTQGGTYPEGTLNFEVGSAPDGLILSMMLDEEGYQMRSRSRAQYVAAGRHQVWFRGYDQTGRVSAKSEVIEFTVEKPKQPVAERFAVMPAEGETVRTLDVPFNFIYEKPGVDFDRDAIVMRIETADAERTINPGQTVRFDRDGEQQVKVTLYDTVNDVVRYEVRRTFRIVSNNLTLEVLSPENGTTYSSDVILKARSFGLCRFRLNEGQEADLVTGLPLNPVKGENFLEVMCKDPYSQEFIKQDIFFVYKPKIELLAGTVKVLDSVVQSIRSEEEVPVTADFEAVRRAIEKDIARTQPQAGSEDVANEVSRVEARAQATQKRASISKSVKQVKKKNETEIRIRIDPEVVLYNFSVYEDIPKDVAYSASEIESNHPFTVIESDPLIVWSFAKVDQEIEITYSVKGDVSSSKVRGASTVAVAGTITSQTVGISMFDLWPLLIIPLVSVFFIFFHRFSPHTVKMDEHMGMLIEYVEQAREMGGGDKAIRKRLEESGWPSHLVNQAIKQAQKAS